MASDTFLDQLRADWLGQTIDIDRLKRLTRRRRSAARLLMLAKLASAAVALVFSAWFAYRAVVAGSAIHALGGVALCAAFPLTILEYVSARRGMRIGGADTPAGVLLHARQQIEVSRRWLRGCRSSAALLAACAAAALGLHRAGLAKSDETSLLAAIWGGTALLVWLWQSWRERRLAVEADRYDQLLAEFSETDRQPGRPGP